VTGSEALQRLKDGNARFVRGAPEAAAKHASWRDVMSTPQTPFATLLGCSDSRVPPEIVFDQGIGDLFIVRVAGNVVGPETLGSLGYALAHLGTPLFVVLGHEQCGAVKAALDARFRGTTEPRVIDELVSDIVPALDSIDPGEADDRQWERAVEANVRYTVGRLAATPAGSAAIEAGRIVLVGAICELHTGRVRFLETTAPRTA